MNKYSFFETIQLNETKPIFRTEISTKSVQSAEKMRNCWTMKFYSFQYCIAQIVINKNEPFISLLCNNETDNIPSEMYSSIKEWTTQKGMETFSSGLHING